MLETSNNISYDLRNIEERDRAFARLDYMVKHGVHSQQNQLACWQSYGQELGCAPPELSSVDCSLQQN